MKAFIANLVRGESLSEEQMERAVSLIMAGEATPAQIGSLVTALRIKGEKGPKRNMVLLNAAAAFAVAGLDKDMTEGIKRAGDSIDSGAALKKLDALIAFTRSCKLFDLKNPEGFFHELNTLSHSA